MNDYWFDMWFDYKKGMISTMYHNMTADLECGYNPLGDCIQHQKKAIADYEEDFGNQLMEFTKMEDKVRNRWCYYDMLKRGVITR